MANSFAPLDLIAASEQALAAWDGLSADEKRAGGERMGLITAEGRLHPDYDWTPERYAREYGGDATDATLEYSEP